jgi:peptidylprolyl isomerase
MTRFRSIALPLTVLSVAAAAATGCGGGNKDGFRSSDSKIDGDPATTLPAELASTKSSIPQRKAGAPLPEQKNIVGVSTDMAKKPTVPKATGAAPKDLEGSDVVTGTGEEAKEGDTVTVKYVGTLFKTGKQFDASWDRKPSTFDFTIGQNQVIQGWDQGVPGMKVGGRRVLVIPADLAYGASGQPPTIPPDSPLVFVVDLKKIKKA